MWFVAAAAAALAALAFGAGLAVPRVRPSGLRGAVLRWGHAAVWILLAGLFAVIGLGEPASSLAAPLGLSALGCYLAFLWALAGARRD